MNYGRNIDLNEMTERIINYQLELIKNAEQGNTYIICGWRLHQVAAYNEALRCYERGLEISPNNAELWCKKGLTHHNLGENEEAEYCYKKSLSIEEDKSEAIYYLGFLMMQVVKYNKAIKLFYRVIDLDKENGMAYYYLAKALIKEGSEREAKQLIIERMVKTYPNVEAMILIAYGEVKSNSTVKYNKKDKLTHLIEILKEKMDVKELHCYGDSHRSLLSGNKLIKCHNVGAGTIYKLNDKNSKSGARKRILEDLEKRKGNKAGIVLVFGEIDIMEHIYKNIYRKNDTLDKMITELAKRYIEFAVEIENKGYPTMVVGPSFSGIDYNSYGSVAERNKVLRSLNKALENRAHKNNIVFATLCNYLIDANNRPYIELSRDGRHLDNFPKHSRVFQSILLSKLIDGVERYKTKREDENKMETDKRLIIIRKKDNVEEGEMIFEGTCGEKLVDCVVDGNEFIIVIDMMDHIQIDGVQIGVPKGMDNSFAVSFEIDKLTNKGVERVGRIDKIISNQDVLLKLEGTVCRGLRIYIQVRNKERIEKIRSVVVK